MSAHVFGPHTIWRRVSSLPLRPPPHRLTRRWTFDCNGACTSIPHIPPGPERTRACNARRARVRAYPTAVAHGLLWVWPESGPQAAQEAAASEVGRGVVTENRTTWYRRELPTRCADTWCRQGLACVQPLTLCMVQGEGNTKVLCSLKRCRAVTQLENLLDPAHVPFAHHGISVSKVLRS